MRLSSILALTFSYYPAWAGLALAAKLWLEIPILTAIGLATLAGFILCTAIIKSQEYKSVLKLKSRKESASNVTGIFTEMQKAKEVVALYERASSARKKTPPPST